jgi:hypothetical protein
VLSKSGKQQIAAAEWVHPHNGQNVMQGEHVQALFLAAIQFGRSLMVDATVGVPTEWVTRAAAWFVVPLPRMGYVVNATFAPTQAFVAARMQRSLTAFETKKKKTVERQGDIHVGNPNANVIDGLSLEDGELDSRNLLSF